MISSNVVFRAAMTLAVIGTVAAARPAHFHTTLKKSQPAAHDTLATAPKQLKLWFSEKIELKLSSVTLADGMGMAMAVGALSRTDSADAPVVVPVTKTLGAGTYTITWKAASDDGHPATGKVEFVVKTH